LHYISEHINIIEIALSRGPRARQALTSKTP